MPPHLVNYLPLDDRNVEVTGMIDTESVIVRTPPLKQTYFISRANLVFERGIKGIS